MIKKFVIVESPFRGLDHAERVRNVRYACQCLRDSIDRGEIPFLSHLLYPQVLDEDVITQRKIGIDLNLILIQLKADLVAVYEDLGISNGMHEAIERATKHKVAIQYRKLGKR